MPKLRVARYGTHLSAALAVLVLTLAQGACSGTERAAAPRASGGRTSGGASSGGSSPVAGGGTIGGTAGGASGGAAGDANAGGEGGIGSQPESPLCSPAQAWSAGQRLRVSAAGDDTLASLSGDELSIAWFVGAELHYADRADPSADFGASVTVDGGERYFSGAALSSDGLTLIGARKDGKSFGVLRRASRAASFTGPFDETLFSELAAAPGTFRARGPFGDPVLAPDGLSLVYSNLDRATDGGPSLYEATRLGTRDAWPFGDPIEGEMLFVNGGRFRRPSALSADKRTLFYGDEVENDSRAAFRSVVTGPFETTVSLGERAHAVPNAACDRLYYSAPGAQGLDLYVAARRGP